MTTGRGWGWSTPINHSRARLQLRSTIALFGEATDSQELRPCKGGYRWLGQGPFIGTARSFQSGRSQAVRLPKDYRFQGSEVVVKHFDNGVLLLPIDG